VHAKDLLVDDRCNWKAIEAVRKRFPEPHTVSAFAFVKEAIDSIDRRALVIASENEEVFSVL